MATGRYLHFGFNFDETPKIEELEAVFNLATDWLRYAPNCWIVWTTTTSIGDWHARVKAVLSPKDEFIIYRLDTQERHGWISKWVWEWLDKQR